ncbi:sensor histidine kinase [Frankia sp. CiP3]|uniref:sensor histidine kinase n=1 Tax=Frankia sp. CiP3 TaxID=2880971 RepID=UPI001EF64487|nr:sensor histidine kinase [Frankia sp. CiP3]
MTGVTLGCVRRIYDHSYPGPRWVRRLCWRSLAGQVLVVQVIVVTVLVAAATAAFVVQARRGERDAARGKALAVATAFAQSPGLVAALRSPDVSATLQPRAEATRRATGVDFVVVMSPAGVRYTHPDPARIGGVFVGHIAAAARGKAFTETYTGTLGPSVRAVVPVLDERGDVAGMVAAGITLERISATLRRQLPVLIGTAAAVLILAACGEVLVSRRLRRQTRSLRVAEIVRLYEHHEAVLHAVREGLLVVGTDHRLLLANDEAVRLLGLPAMADGRPVRDLLVAGSLAELLDSGRRATDEIHLAGDRVLAVNQTPASRDGRPLGTVTTLRDSTELLALTGELDSVRGFADALRAQAHEAANRLHTVVTLIELNREQEAIEFATEELAASQQLADRLLTALDEPVLAALLLGKAAQAHEHGIDFVITDDTQLHATQPYATPVDPRALVTMVGNLVDNAVDAALAGQPPRWVAVTVRIVGEVTGEDGEGEREELVVRVADSGPGLEPARTAAAFARGWSTKAGGALHGRGLGLALVQQVVARYGGRIDVTNDRGAVFTVRLPLEPVVGALPAVRAVP